MYPTAHPDNMKASADTATEQSNPHLKEFTESPDLLARRRNDEPLIGMNLGELNH